MKHCINCSFMEKAVWDGPHGSQMAMICKHQECTDPVIGEPIPCNVARRDDDFCGFKGKLWKKREDEQPKAPLIQMVDK